MKKYRKLCKEYGEKPFPIRPSDDVKDVIGQHLSMVGDFYKKLEQIVLDFDEGK